MADGLFYSDVREPFVIADLAAISPLSTAVALYTASSFPGGGHAPAEAEGHRGPWAGNVAAA